MAGIPTTILWIIYAAIMVSLWIFVFRWILSRNDASRERLATSAGGKMMLTVGVFLVVCIVAWVAVAFLFWAHS
jgi:hypothetical protein